MEPYNTKREFVTLPSFFSKWKDLGLTEEDLRLLEISLLENPKVGPVMKSTGGVRKMRFALENRGKSGSMRVIYIDFDVYEKIYFLDVYQKSSKDNLSMAERNEIRVLVTILENTLKKER